MMKSQAVCRANPCGMKAAVSYVGSVKAIGWAEPETDCFEVYLAKALGMKAALAV